MGQWPADGFDPSGSASKCLIVRNQSRFVNRCGQRYDRTIWGLLEDWPLAPLSAAEAPASLAILFGSKGLGPCGLTPLGSAPYHGSARSVPA